MKNFTDKVVVITGAGSGIGRALAQACHRQGAWLALNDYHPDTLAETVSLLGVAPDQVCTAAFDVANRADMLTFATQVANQFGRVNVVINNAGVGLADTDLTSLNPEWFDRVMDTNFGGVLNGSRAFLPYLEQQPEAALVNVSSVWGLAGVRQAEAYVSSKFAVNGFTLSLMQAYRWSSLQVHCVYPGGISTNIARSSLGYDASRDNSDALLRRSPHRAAEVIMRGIIRNKRRIRIGSEAYLVDYLTRWKPLLGSTLINRYLDTKRKY
jgi:NAD(P)-dependent dehydrogenase (short-subunit alcohol dehydrogenase family)